MALRDRFFTPQVAKAILSPWRIIVSIVVAVGLALLGVHVVLAVLIGLVLYVVLVAVAMPRKGKRVHIDPFAIGEPWRQHVKGALRAKRRFDEILASAPPGAGRDRLRSIGERLQHGVEECWHIAKRGDQIDASVTRLNLPSARSDHQLLSQRPKDAATEATLASLQAQIDSGDRLKAISANAAQQLRLLEVRLSELAARAQEVAVGGTDQVSYGKEVDDVITELEGMRLALDETARADAPPRVDFGELGEPGV